jgi:hypothetical protein
MTSKRTNITIQPEEHVAISEKADAQGYAFSEYLRIQALEFPVEKPLQLQIAALAARVGVTTAEVLQGILCDYFARLMVETEKGSPRLFPEFAQADGKAIPAMELLDMLVESYRHDKRRQEREIRERYGIPNPAAPMVEAMRARIEKAQAEGILPAGEIGLSHRMICDLLDSLERGEVTREEVREIVRDDEETDGEWSAEARG